MMRKVVLSLSLGLAFHAIGAQCTGNNYIRDGAPSALLDCQPTESLPQLAPEAMLPVDQDLAKDQYQQIAQAARFYGFDLDAPGWSYYEVVSPLIQKHLLLSFTTINPLCRASNFVAVLPRNSKERVQVLLAFANGLHPFLPGWQAKGSYATFNVLMQSERGTEPISRYSDWIAYGVLYLTLVGRTPVVPLETDSIKANWDLSAKRGATPLLSVFRNGDANILFSDLAAGHTISWKLFFNKRGAILKAEKNTHSALSVKHMQTLDDTGLAPATPVIMH